MPLFDFYTKENGEHFDRAIMTQTEARLRAKRLKLSFERVVNKEDERTDKALKRAKETMAKADKIASDARMQAANEAWDEVGI